MPSVALARWGTDRLSKLDDIEASHAAVGGTAPGRRYATMQIHAYTLMLSSQFQGFCRDLHDECVAHFASAIQPAVFRTTIKQLLIRDRKLDHGNPNAGNLGSDFDRFGLSFLGLRGGAGQTGAHLENPPCYTRGLEKRNRASELRSQKAARDQDAEAA